MMNRHQAMTVGQASEVKMGQDEIVTDSSSQ